LKATIALDAMGGDHGPAVVVPAALHTNREFPDTKLILVGDEEAITTALRQHRAAPGARLAIRHTSQRVEMGDLPSQALRGKKDSSMRVCLDLVKEGTAHACVSAGNTGALMVTARFVLKTLPGIDRPAIVSAIPTIKGHTHLLDLGANVDSTPRQLLQFAVMGSVLRSAVENVPRPRVALLNIGEEEIKGNEKVKETARLLEASDLNYIGYVEGDGIYAGNADVIVCDGFVGNVALKSSEGVARMVQHYAKEEFCRNLFRRFAGIVALPVIRAFRDRIDPRRYNGASLVGLRGIVVKSHGSADEVAFSVAIREAIAEIKKNVPGRISEQLESILMEAEAV
jgi:glycerol-3-phosphate acyltransferase PlsX